MSTPERLPDYPYKTAVPLDNRYRDLKLAGAAISPAVFDPLTNQLIGGSGSASSFNCTSSNLADEACVGNVIGVKPQQAADGTQKNMAMLDTPIVNMDPLSNYNAAYSYLNINDTSYYDLNQLITAGATDKYGFNNAFRDVTFPIGGSIAGCPEILAFANPPAVQQSNTLILAAHRRDELTNCAAYFILNESLNPGYTGEIPSQYGNNDPLTVNANKDTTGALRSIVNNCQPLVQGTDALKAQLGSPTEINGGGAPVWRYTGQSLAAATGISVANGKVLSAVYNEDEQLLSDNLYNTWKADFISKPANPLYILTKTLPNPFTYPIEFPCVQDFSAESTPESPITTIFESPSESAPESAAKSILPICKSTPETTPETTPESIAQCKAALPGIPSDYANQVPARAKDSKGNIASYCPNVQKIFDPSGPFTPRLEFTPGNTDRDTYSPKTDVSLSATINGLCIGHLGYTDYNQKQSSWKYMNELPVQCGIVPVDILNTRSAAFNSCITQRINYNMQAYIKLWELTGKAPPQQTAYDAKQGPGGSTLVPTTYSNGDFRPPCATRFFETDTKSDCPVNMSIQQCCHIIIKDVVPKNYLMFSVREGERHNRIATANIVKNGEAVANIVDADYATNPDEAGANMYITEQDYQKALTDTETLNKSNVPSNSSIAYPTEPPEYLFSNYVQLYTDPSTGSQVGYNMPYIRWWDTGISADDSGSRYGRNGYPIQRHGGSFLNTLGGDIAFVGVGRPERSVEDAKIISNNAPDPSVAPEYQTASQLSYPQPAQMARVGGWAPEFTGWQSLYARRKFYLNCIARYEKIGKFNGPEDRVLYDGGASYITMGNPPLKIPSIQQPWPMGWRGYVTDTHGQGFPTTLTGLSNAQAGDYIIYTINGLPQIAYVVKVDQTAGAENITVDWQGRGKYSLATGLPLVEGQERETIYKSTVPSQIVTALSQYNLYATIGSSQPSCADPNYDICVLPPDAQGNDQWTTAAIYRVYTPAANGNPPIDLTRWCTVPSQWVTSNFPDGGPTYNWQGPLTQQISQAMIVSSGQGTGINPNSLAPANVITQPMTIQYPSNLWAWCVAAGFDPPNVWKLTATGGYTGPGTAPIQNTALCGATWGSCSSSADPSEVIYLPATSGNAR